MKRIAIVGAVVAALAISPVATAGGKATAQKKPQVVPTTVPQSGPGLQVWRAGSHLMY